MHRKYNNIDSVDKFIEKKNWTLRRVLTFSVSGVILLFIIYLLFFSDKTSKLNIEKERISIFEVKQGAFQEFIAVTGTIEPIQTIYLDLTDGGRITDKFITEGSFVNTGDAIIRLENTNLSLQVMNTQSSFLAAESQLKLAQLTFEQNSLLKQNQLLELNVSILNQKRIYDANKILLEKNLASQFEFDASREQYEYLLKSRELMKEVLKKDSVTSTQLVKQSKDNFERSKTYLKLVEDQLANLTVRAPIKGQLTSLNAEIGQSVGSGYKLGRIDNTDSYKVRAEVDEHYIARVREGQTCEYNFNGKVYQLNVKTVYPQVSNGKFLIDLLFSQVQPEGIRRGQTVHIRLQLSDVSSAILIENGGFYSATGGQWIFVIDNSGSFAVKRSIKIGRQNPQFYEILGGLKPGEKVITSSYENYGDIEKLILK
jgi:HlyD family secretion protein